MDNPLKVDQRYKAYKELQAKIDAKLDFEGDSASEAASKQG